MLIKLRKNSTPFKPHFDQRFKEIKNKLIAGVIFQEIFQLCLNFFTILITFINLPHSVLWEVYRW